MILTTNQAAKMLNRKPQTLRKWACLGDAPIEPIRINGRLAWRKEDVQNLISGAHETNKKETPTKVETEKKRRGRPATKVLSIKLNNEALLPFKHLHNLLDSIGDGNDLAHQVHRAFRLSPYATLYTKALFDMIEIQK